VQGGAEDFSPRRGGAKVDANAGREINIDEQDGKDQKWKRMNMKRRGCGEGNFVRGFGSQSGGGE